MKSRSIALVFTFVLGGFAGCLASFFYFSSLDEALAPEAQDLSVESSEVMRPSVPLGRPEDDALVEDPEVGLDFSERVERAMSYDSYRRRQYELERLFENLSKEEASGVLEDILEVREPQLRGSLMRPFFVKWGELDGPLAFEVAVELKGRDRRDGVSAVLAGWSHTDVHAAWGEAFPMIMDSASPFSSLAGGAVAEMAKQDPDFILSLLAKDSSNQKYSSFGRSLINEAFKSDRQAELLGKLGVIENAEDRNKMVSQIFQRWGSLDTGAPLDALAGIADPAEARSALEGFLKGWVESDREGALSYAFENSEDPAVKASLASMLQRSFSNGSKEDSEALIAQLEEKGILKEYAPSLVPQLSFMQPEIGLKLASIIEDSQERIQQQQRALSGLARMDFEKARDFLDGVESDEERAKLLPSVTWSLQNRSDGGSQLVSLFDKVPQGKKRTELVEQLLANGSRPNVRLSDDYKDGLAILVEAESDLSAKAMGNWEKLVAPNP